MKLLHKSDIYALKADADGVAILTFYKGKTIKAVHASKVKSGWNLLDDLSHYYHKSDQIMFTFFKAGIPPSNIAWGLQGSPIIPLSEAVSDQKELKDGEDDLDSALEPSKDSETPTKEAMISFINRQPNQHDLDNIDERDKSGDPFLFSSTARNLLPKV